MTVTVGVVFVVLTLVGFALSALFSGLAVRRMLDRLDLVAVLKSRE